MDHIATATHHPPAPSRRPPRGVWDRRGLQRKEAAKLAKIKCVCLWGRREGEMREGEAERKGKVINILIYI